MLMLLLTLCCALMHITHQNYSYDPGWIVFKDNLVSLASKPSKASVMDKVPKSTKTNFESSEHEIQLQNTELKQKTVNQQCLVTEHVVSYQNSSLFSQNHLKPFTTAEYISMFTTFAFSFAEETFQNITVHLQSKLNKTLNKLSSSDEGRFPLFKNITYPTCTIETPKIRGFQSAIFKAMLPIYPPRLSTPIKHNLPVNTQKLTDNLKLKTENLTLLAKQSSNHTNADKEKKRVEDETNASKLRIKGFKALGKLEKVMQQLEKLKIAPGIEGMEARAALLVMREYKKNSLKKTEESLPTRFLNSIVGNFKKARDGLLKVFFEVILGIVGAQFVIIYLISKMYVNAL